MLKFLQGVVGFLHFQKRPIQAPSSCDVFGEVHINTGRDLQLQAAARSPTTHQAWLEERRGYGLLV